MAVGLKDLFYVTFILDDRYKFFVDGFFMTILLALSSFVSGAACDMAQRYIRFAV